MPAFPSGLIDWLQPGAVGAGFAIVWTEVRGLHRRVVSGLILWRANDFNWWYGQGITLVNDLHIGLHPLVT